MGWADEGWGFAGRGCEGGGGVVWGNDELLSCYVDSLDVPFSRAESCCWGGMTLIARHIKIIHLT